MAGELAQLRAYVNESMPTVQTVKEMSEERQKCESEIVRLKVRNEQLTGENNALQIRLKSINEILSIQESQLEAKQTMLGSSPSPFVNEKRYQGLLNKWRTKVFELLVQLKSDALSGRRERHEWEKRRGELCERVEAETSRARILENMLEDKRAEMSVLAAERTALGERVGQLDELNAELERRRADDSQASVELRTTVERLVSEYARIEESFRLASKRLAQLDQRVEFAKNRLGVVKALYEAARRKRASSSAPPPPPPTTINPTTNEQKRATATLNFNMTSMLSSIHGSANLNDAQLSSLDIFNSERTQRDDNDQDKLLVRFIIVPSTVF